MKRGEIYFANLDPTIGNEIRKKRPVLIVSSNVSNQFYPLVTIIPLTSNITKVYSFEVLIAIKESNLSKPSKAQCHQIRAISKLRIDPKKIGRLSSAIMEQIEYSIKIHLNLI